MRGFKVGWASGDFTRMAADAREFPRILPVEGGEYADLLRFAALPPITEDPNARKENYPFLPPTLSTKVCTT